MSRSRVPETASLFRREPRGFRIAPDLMRHFVPS